MKGDNIIEVLNAEGNMEKIEVVKYFKFKNDDKKYIIYKNVDSRNEKLVFSAEVVENNDSILLNEISDKNIINRLKQIMEEIYSE